jgi:hypothetical protein
VVIDGASSAGRHQPDDGCYADRLAGELALCLQRADDQPMTEHLTGVIREVVACADRDGIPLAPGEAAPSTGVLLCRWTADNVEVLAFGRSTAIVYLHDGRSQRIAEAIVCRWPRAEVDAVLVMTDGVANVVDRYAVDGFPHWHHILGFVAADGVQALVDHVHAVEGTDPNRRRWPRSKVHEDKVAALIMTETYDARPRMQPPYSIINAADRAMERGEYTTAIDLYGSVEADFSAAAEQNPSDNDLAHALYYSHVARLDALARAGRLDELATLATSDSRARRRLDRQLHEEGRADELRLRAANGDNTALYLLIRFLRTVGEDAVARQTAADIAPDNEYAQQLAHQPQPPNAP